MRIGFLARSYSKAVFCIFCRHWPINSTGLVGFDTLLARAAFFPLGPVKLADWNSGRKRRRRRKRRNRKQDIKAELNRMFRFSDHSAMPSDFGRPAFGPTTTGKQFQTIRQIVVTAYRVPYHLYFSAHLHIQHTSWVRIEASQSFFSYDDVVNKPKPQFTS